MSVTTLNFKYYGNTATRAIPSPYLLLDILKKKLISFYLSFYLSYSDYRTMKVFPWLKLNGELNGVLLRRFQEIILAHVLLHPGVKQVTLIQFYSY